VYVYVLKLEHLYNLHQSSSLKGQIVFIKFPVSQNQTQVECKNVRYIRHAEV